jgi:ABC-type nitrate/sulfonate/bicarbonate transport system substrate-binding protein
MPQKTVKLISFSRPIAFVAAEQKGFFAKEGLSIDYTQTPNSVTQIRGLLDGTWDLGHSAADNVMAYVEKEGVDLFVFLVADLGLAQKLIVRPEFNSYKQLRGKVLGVDALDTGYAYVLRKMLQRNGVGTDEYQLNSVGGTAHRLDALRSGKVAAVLLSTPHDDVALREGFRLFAPASEYFPNYPGTTMVATRHWAQANTDTLVAYIRGYLAGADWATDPANRDEAIDLLSRDQEVDRATAEGRFELERQSRTVDRPTLAQVNSALQVVLDLRWELASMSGPKPPTSKYFDPSYWRRATG